MLVLGIDDAGRGPVIGPMILAGCLIEEEHEREFKKLGIRDSKQLTQKRREFLATIVKEKAVALDFAVISPEEIDVKNAKGINLNHLEAIKTAEIINNINKGFGKIIVYIDCPSPNITKWQDYLKTKIDNLSNLEIHCEHKADKNHISCSAASILAKCFREEEMSKLKEKYGDEVGSGYCSDPATKKFLENHAEKFKKDGIFRQTWSTWQTVVSNEKQQKLKF